MEQKKPKQWMRYIIYVALALPSIVLFMNENSEYELMGIAINSLLVVILAVAGLFLFYENFIDKAQVKPKPADLGPKTPMSGQDNWEQSKPYSPYNKPPFG